MENKKSFILYSDQRELFEHLPNDVAGELIKHIFSYVNDENPTTDNALVNLAFLSIKASLKRDLIKWQSQIKQRSDAGKKSALSRQRNSTSVNERTRKATDSVSVSVNVSDNEIEEDNTFFLFWDGYPTKVGKTKVQAKWSKLTVKEKETILTNLPKYVAYKPFEGYNHPNPETFLNQRRWEDEAYQTEPIKQRPPLDRMVVHCAIQSGGNLLQKQLDKGYTLEELQNFIK